MWSCPKCGEQVESNFEVCWACGTSRNGVEDPHFVSAEEMVSHHPLRKSSTAVRQGGTNENDPLRRLQVSAQRMEMIAQLVFVGLNGYAVALNRDTGAIVWSNNHMHSGYVTFLLDGDRLIVSTNGYIYCLDPLTGEILWYNPMKGYGMGTPTSLTSVRGQSSQVVEQQAAAAIAAAAAASSSGTAGS